MKVYQLQGLKFEQAFEREVSNFKYAIKDVATNDILGAMLCRDQGRMDLLHQLHGGEIHVATEVVDENTVFEDLIFTDSGN